jgi:hypothetical protein
MEVLNNLCEQIKNNLDQSVESYLTENEDVQLINEDMFEENEDIQLINEDIFEGIDFGETDSEAESEY